MVRIRLRRVGRKKQPSYRIVVADARSPRDGRYIEVIGFYNPRTEPTTMEVKEERALHWLSVGAQPSEAVQRILNKVGTAARYDRMRQGEAVETLVAEAEAEAAARGPISPKTQHAAAPKEVAPAAIVQPATAPAPEPAPEPQAVAEEVVEDAAAAEEAVADDEAPAEEA